MKLHIKSISIVLFFMTTVNIFGQQYDTKKAIAYAEKWWNGFNPDYKVYENADCASFVSDRKSVV